MSTDIDFEARLRLMAAAIPVPAPSERRLEAIMAARRAREGFLAVASGPRFNRRSLLPFGLALAGSIAVLLIPTEPTGQPENQPRPSSTLWPEPLMAQARDGAILPDSETVLALDGAAVRPGLWVYRRRPIGGPPGRPEWIDTLSIRAGAYEGEATWNVSWRRGSFHREQTDLVESLFVRKTDLWPLSRTYSLPGGRAVRQVFAPESSVVISEDQGRTSVVSVSGFSSAGGAVISGWGASHYLLQALPLHPRWRGNIRIIGITNDGQAIDFRLPLQVLREETITVPAGTFDCWAVAMGTQRPAFVFWVSKRERWIVKEGLGPAEEIGPDVVGSERVLISATP